MHNSLLSVTIDAGVLAVPCVDCTEDDAFLYVEILLDWKKLLDEPWAVIYGSEQSLDSLSACGLYPLRNQLEKLFKAHGIKSYDVNTVTTLVNRFLKLPFFETDYQVTDVSCDEKHFEIDPDVRLMTPDGLRSELARCIMLIAILRKYCPQPLGGHLLVLREAPKPVIRVKAHIDMLKHNRDDIPALPCPPEFFEGDVWGCADFRGLINCLDESTILVGATDDSGISLAVQIALFKDAIKHGDSPEWRDIKNIIPVIGAKFRMLCQRICTDHGDSVPPKILRAIVETVKGNNLSAVHAIRTSRGGNAKQKIRGSDNAKAQRRDIDLEFHLHYWECPNGKVELSSVVYHEDLSIP